jgi:hypothetical protein
VRLEFGSQIEDRDVLRTGPTSSLQIRFVDESFISLRENSQVAIEEYRFAGKEDGTESAAFALIKGGFRKVTGLIGRLNQKNYRVTTPNATIGIRGTDYAVRHCSGDCGEGVKDGLYGSVLGLSHGTNRVAVANKGGESVFGKDEHFYVPDANTRPQPMLEPPAFVSVKPQGKAQTSQQGGGQGSGEEKAQSNTGVAAESRPATVGEPPASITLDKADPYQATETLTAAGVPAVFGAGATAAGFVLAGEDFIWGSVFAPLSQLTTASTANGEKLTAFNSFFDFGEGSSGGITGAEGTLGSDMLGSVPAVNAHYGRWINGVLTDTFDGATFTPGTGVHWLYGYQMTDPSAFAAKTGVFQFNRIAGTRPTDNSGNIASSMSFGPMFIAFQELKGVIRDMSWSIAGVSHTFKNVDLDLFNTGQGIGFFGFNDTFNNNSGQCAGGPCGTGSVAEVIVEGSFAGTAGDYAGMGIASFSQAGTTSSVQVYHCPTCATTNAGLPLTTLGYAFANGGGAAAGMDWAQAETAIKASPFMTFSGTELTSFDNFGDRAARTSATTAATALAPINGGFGRWDTANVSELNNTPASLNPGTGVHWFYGDIASPQAVFSRTGTVSFAHVGGTSPTDSLGGVGAWSSGNIAVDFTNLSAAMTAQWTTPGGYTWSLNNAPLSISSDTMGVRVETNGPLNSHPSTSCAGGACSTGQPIQFVNVNGQFMGVLGNHIGTAISTFHGPANRGTASVQVFSCVGQSGC